MVNPRRAAAHRRRAVLVLATVAAIGPLAAVTVGSGPAGPAASTSTVAPLSPPPGATSSQRQDLSGPCETAVAPIRGLMGEYRSARELTPAASTELNEGLGAATKACGAEEWRRFHDLELLFWLQRS